MRLIQHTKKLFRRALTATLAIAALMATSACESFVYDDLEPCPSGVKVRFVYDYNMEFANSFYSRVDNLTLYVYNSDGRCMITAMPTTAELHDENFKLEINLKPGTYTMVAYGGVDCDEASFAFDDDPMYIDNDQRRLRLRAPSRPDWEGECSENLYSLYYGSATVVVPEASPAGKVDAKVEMIKNTNNFRLVLQQINGDPLSFQDFDYEIYDDNILFNYDNSLLPTDLGVTYKPWTKGNVSVGTTTSGQQWITTYAELSTSRLIYRGKGSDKVDSRAPSGIKPGTSSVAEPRLRIYHVRSGNTILDIPLVNYLELYKSQVYANMPIQEFLDRQSNWDIIFFLDGSLHWVSSYIEVNGWIVRLNDIDM